MLKDIAEAMLGRRPFDLVIRNVQIVNVFSASIVSGSIGIVNGHIAGVFGPEEALDSRRSIDGGNAYALPGFVDSHMHLESSMLTPEHFAQVALSCGTTTVCADPHEIANVLGIEGVRGLADACRSLPLRVLLTAPSTIPSAPGLEDSGFDVGPAEMEALLDIPGVAGLGEVMDFNAVAAWMSGCSPSSKLPPTGVFLMAMSPPSPAAACRLSGPWASTATTPFPLLKSSGRSWLWASRCRYRNAC